MNNTTIVYSAFVSPEELWKSRRVLSAKAVFLDLYNSSDDTHPPVSYTHLTLPTNREV